MSGYKYQNFITRFSFSQIYICRERFKVKKILFLAGDLNNSGGTERVSTIIANALAEKKYNVSFASIFNGDKPIFSVSDRVNLITLINNKRKIRSFFFIPLIILKIRQLLKKLNPDYLIVVETMSVLFTLPASLGLRTKVIAWEHFNFVSNLGRRSRDFSRKLAAKYCYRVIVLTDKDKDYWLSGTKHKNNIISIPNPNPYPINVIANKNNKIALSVGRLTYQKGFDLLIKSWIDVTKKHPDWKLIILGEGEDRLLLENMIESNKLSDSVFLKGNVKDVVSFYKDADIFLLSSRFEGFPMVLLEALSFGLPVVAYDCNTGPSEILEGTNSPIVLEEDVKGFSDSINNLIENDILRKEITLKSIQKSKLYLIDNIIPKWMRIFKDEA